MIKKLKYKYRAIFFVFILILLSLLLIRIRPALAQKQVISVVPSSFYHSVGDAFIITVNYDVTDGNKYLTGLGINVHFNSNKLDYTGYINFLNKGDMNSIPILLEDTSDEDKNKATDMKINISWVSISSQWPSEDLPAILAKLNFKVKQDAEKGDTPINISVFEHEADYGVTLNNTIVTVAQ